ncbi:carbohydrate ABC transporter permease [Sporosarcina sp. ANT_H38]|uniref:carbohydrate ABC transporter permease n=1 Tax=Sporosarcina sp. ANT_H38 TaxID=2597358 RepID=UPI0011F3A79B|nr:carbohydrate ABC transporter permease [Sporosarcina sp. ANT_H38]KAA0965091.1 carbohydrate ABC transporter permease [Sporosarcina sp. ANT_H38]
MKTNLLTSDDHSSLVNRLKDIIFTVIKNIFLTIISLLMVYPLYWLITSAFKTNDEFFSDPYSLPSTWVFENIVRAWEVADLGRAMINSTIVTVSATLLTVFLGALTAYALSRFTFKLKGFLIVFFLLGMLIPIHSTLVPLFTMMNLVGLLDTYWALILPYTAFELPIAIFLTVAYMTTIPKELEEAAIIDGSGYWGIFFKMMLPLSVPALSTVAILSFLRYWNEFVFALVFINDSSLKTLPLSLAIFSDGFSTDYVLTMAAMTVAVVPTIVMYLIFQEQIMKGMVAGSVKG